MPVFRTKPIKIKRSKIVDQSVTKFVLFCETELSIPNGSDIDYFQSLVTDGIIQFLEVYGLTSSNAENGTIEVGGTIHQTSKGEKRYTGDVMTEYYNALEDYSFYTNKYAYLVSANDVIRGITDSNNILPFRLNDVTGGDKEPVNDGSTPSTPKIMFNIAGVKVKGSDEWELGFTFDSLVVLTGDVYSTTDFGLDSGLH